MEGYRTEIPLLKLKESVIIKYFDKVKKSLIKLAICQTCCKPVVFLADEYKQLAEHLKLHPEIWAHYLDALADAIDADHDLPWSIDPLKLVTLIVDSEKGESFTLKLPLSRIHRKFDNSEVCPTLDGFEQRLQTQYNSCPVGKFAGPYDQNESLPLNLQLPGADIDFDQYTQFRHSESVPCRTFSVKKDSYDQTDDLAKIEVFKIKDDDDTSEDEECESKEVLTYTCQKRQCYIPCPCSPCNGEDQCCDHKIRHEELFDTESDMVVIRSRDEFCSNQSFFERGYLIKFPGIPIHCKKCKRDFLHHICYHFDLHETCKFCRKNRFKTFATTTLEFEENIRKQSNYLKSVCPHCDNKFCEPHFRKKHEELEHGDGAKYTCDFCASKFHAKQSKEYHVLVFHSDDHKKEKCEICGKEFNAKVNLVNHMKYVHSQQKDHSCPVCEMKFKQKRDMRIHMLNIHEFNMSKAMYGNFEDQERFDCDLCDSTFKYKKNLNAHVRMKHQSTSNSYKCDLCPSVYKELKNLNAHKKLKHSATTEEFPCVTCGKTFNQKKSLKRHVKIHENEHE